MRLTKLIQRPMTTLLAEFENLGMSASFHYADDSGKEWGLAKKDQDQAIILYHDHPELQVEMMKISKGFLWSLSKELA